MAKKHTRSSRNTFFYSILLAGIAVTLLFLVDNFTILIERINLKITDLHFNLKYINTARNVQAGLLAIDRNIRLSNDIVMVGVDFETLNRIGRWPFPRWRHADLINNFTRISDQSQRERALFLDFFFIESSDAYDDALLHQSLAENGRVFLETVIQRAPVSSLQEDELFSRHEIYYERFGKIENITGDTAQLPLNLGLEPPLYPLVEVSGGMGHANFFEDLDRTYRRQPMILKLSKVISLIDLDTLTIETFEKLGKFERLAWFDNKGIEHHIEPGAWQEQGGALYDKIRDNSPPQYIDDDNDNVIDRTMNVVYHFQDEFMPAITLALAMQYFNTSIEELEVVLGSHIRIPNPQYFNTDTEVWEPYRVLEREERKDGAGNVTRDAVYRTVPMIDIPIDSFGFMRINFIGPRSDISAQGIQTFPVRPYHGYLGAAIPRDRDMWPRTRAVANDIIMVGAFSSGLADDEKPTPYGLMYGIEMHANALNTIIMDNFIHEVPQWIMISLVLGFMAVLIYVGNRTSSIISTLAAGGLFFGLFIVTTILFSMENILLEFSVPALAIIIVHLGILIMRIILEENEKRYIRETFGKYVSPRVVDEILQRPPELGGVDKEITVMFSDIRGFTTLSESISPQELITQLNTYLSAMTDVILEYQGTLDKYVGDEIMCFWGAPIVQADHALRACKCAISQMEILKDLNEKWTSEKRLDIGIGINSGVMTVGNVGSQGRLNYTLIGDNVNLGARLEGTNKNYGTHIIISENTYRLVQDAVIVRELDDIRVKGKENSIVIYELVALQ